MMAAALASAAAAPGEAPVIVVPPTLPSVVVPSAPPPPQPPVWKPGDGPRSPIPIGNAAGWLTPGDYPPEARRASVGGRSDFILDVGPDGRVTGCSIRSSSGSKILDDQACALVTRRARFFPALDDDGQPTTGTYANRVRWQPPRPRPNRFVNQTVVVEFTLGVDGVPRDCRDDVTGNGAGLAAPELRSPCSTVPRFEPFRDADGHPVERRVRIQTTTTVE